MEKVAVMCDQMFYSTPTFLSIEYVIVVSCQHLSDDILHWHIIP
jgi:hypothetical protein